MLPDSFVRWVTGRVVVQSGLGKGRRPSPGTGPVWSTFVHTGSPRDPNKRKIESIESESSLGELLPFSVTRFISKTSGCLRWTSDHSDILEPGERASSNPEQTKRICLQKLSSFFHRRSWKSGSLRPPTWGR